MPTLKLTLTAELDSQLVPGFPIVRRLVVDEVQAFDYKRTSGGTYVALPLDQIDTVQVFVMQTDREVTLRFQGQSDAGLVLHAGGLVLLFDVDLDAGFATNVTVNNNSGITATLRGLGAGT
jgi:hypothetical protein